MTKTKLKKKKKAIKKKIVKKKPVKRTKRIKKKKAYWKKKVFSPEKFQALFKKGKQRGFITTSEILYFFPEVEKDVEGLENLYGELEKEGIEIK